MALLRKEEIRNMNTEKLKEKLNDFRLDLAKQRAQVKIGGTAENPGILREMRKTIARILTELNARKNKKEVEKNSNM